jgi:hypothetical protein
MVGAAGSNQTPKVRTTAEAFAFNASTKTLTLENITLSGALLASTKSFIINHPTKPGMKLQYGVSEAPEHTVFVRGKTTSEIIELPEYWKALIHEDSITVHLTPMGEYQNLFIAEISAEKIIIKNSLNKNINCYYLIHAERKDVPRLEVEYV